MSGLLWSRIRMMMMLVFLMLTPLQASSRTPQSQWLPGGSWQSTSRRRADACGPGTRFNRRAWDACDQGQCWLTTVNVTSWGAVRTVLDEVTSHVVCMQETRLPGNRQAEASASLCKRGWKMASSPGFIKNSDLSSGVAVLAKAYVDMWHDKADIFPGRLAGCFLRMPTLGVLAVYSIYLEPGSSTAVVEGQPAGARSAGGPCEEPH